MIGVRNTITHLWGGRCEPALPSRHIPESFTQELRAQGLGRPLSSLDDPRLESPELLMLHGFTAEIDEQSRPVYRATPAAGYQQTLILDGDGSVEVETRCGSRVHKLYQDADGKIHQSVCNLS